MTGLGRLLSALGKQLSDRAEARFREQAWRDARFCGSDCRDIAHRKTYQNTASARRRDLRAKQRAETEEFLRTRKGE